MKLSFWGLVRSVLFAHAVGLLALVLLSCVAMMLSYPSESVRLAGILSLSVGGAFLGFYLRAKRVLLSGVFATGLCYAAIPLLVSFFFPSSDVLLLYRFILVFVLLLLSVFPSWLFKKKKRYRRPHR